MKTMTLSFSIALLATQLPAAQTLWIDGTVCRMNRAIDRLIIRSDYGNRVRIALGRSVPIQYRLQTYDRADLRPGDRVHITVQRGALGLLARQLDVTMRVEEALIDSIFRSHRTVTGRFGAREPKTELFTLRLPGPRDVRIDAKGASGPSGRVWVGRLRPGDLLEIRGAWKSKDFLQANSINVLTDHEPSYCTSAARRDEIPAETHSRETSEQRFLDKSSEDSR